MAKQFQPDTSFTFRGMFTAGNPVERPRGTAYDVTDFRVMPSQQSKPWLRLRGGRKQRYNITNVPGEVGTVQQIHQFRDVNFFGSVSHVAQIKFSSSGPRWSQFSLPVYIPDPLNYEPIATANDGGFALTHPVAATNLADRPLFYNGLGVRDATSSRPPFSYFYGGLLRYFGLDAYCPSSNPTVAFTPGAGNNIVAARVKIYVGIYHLPTDHYSNAVLAGQITSTSAVTGTISVGSLGNLKIASHGASELSELYYVFYATLDGTPYDVPYLILNSTLDGPLKVAAGSSSASLSMVPATSDTPNGWVLDLTKERPLQNFPPRPMRSIAMVNGRVYGSLMAGGAGTGKDFSYMVDGRRQAAIAYSAAADDKTDQQWLGDPQQSWPVNNLKYTPNNEQGPIVYPDIVGNKVLVITSTGTFRLFEIGLGLHEWENVDVNRGISSEVTFQKTNRGYAWRTQNGEIVLYDGSSVVSLSENFKGRLAGKVPQCSDYLFDPDNEIDRYELFYTDGTSLCVDFATGEAYFSSGKDFTAARTIQDSAGKRHHVVAKNGFYTQEAQPEDGLIPTTDETYTDHVSNASATTQIVGVWEGNWDSLGDPDWVKELPYVLLIGDGGALAVDWWADLEEVSDGIKRTSQVDKLTDHNITDSLYKARLNSEFHAQHKFRLRLTGHSGDDATFAKFQRSDDQGRFAKNFYGCVLGVMAQVGNSKYRL